MSSKTKEQQNMGVMKHKSMKKKMMHKEHETQEKKSTKSVKHKNN
jgi:hypothetical protein